MNSCILQGRTGNQMFIIAATLAHARRNGYEFCIPPTSANEQLWPSHRFPVPYARFKGELYNEPHFHYAPVPDRDNLVLNGYFQSIKHFEDHKEEVMEVFKLRQYTLPGTVAVHIRRGDYVQYSQQFNLLSSDYYTNAMSEMGSDYEYHFFSDDIEYCKAMFPGHKYHKGQPLSDLREGSCMEHCIMSASSFSWWMALGADKVIAPDMWFGPVNGHHDTKDIYLETWNKIKVA